LVVVATGSGLRFLTGTILAVFVTAYADVHLSQWAWWIPVSAAIGAVMVVGLVAPTPRDLPRLAKTSPGSVRHHKVLVGAS